MAARVSWLQAIIDRGVKIVARCLSKGLHCQACVLGNRSMQAHGNQR
jgi:hypothetical protein